MNTCRMSADNFYENLPKVVTTYLFCMLPGFISFLKKQMLLVFVTSEFNMRIHTCDTCISLISPAQNQFDLEVWYKVFFFTDSCRLDIAINDSG